MNKGSGGAGEGGGQGRVGDGARKHLGVNHQDVKLIL